MDLNLDHLFRHHPPTGPEQVAQYQRIREAGKAFAQVIVDNSPAGPDQSVAIRKVREAVMVTNASIALS